ncbi:FAD-dependent oxidoreductase [Lentzea sp. NPDC059081]|uniref:FAD-dependent oxidoreductase n=1 Tax=Lentzea sp. NPDC059081 TaxID=3346719 RepID=UPI00369FE077
MAAALPDGGKAVSITTGVGVVGGGMAGAWVAHELARRGVPVVLMREDERLPPMSRVWSAGVMRQDLVGLSEGAGADPFTDTSTTLLPRQRELVLDRARAEYARLCEITGYAPILEGFVAPRGHLPYPEIGVGDRVVAAVLDRAAAHGAVVLDGHVTDLVVEDGTCRGVRLLRGGDQVDVACAQLVLAPGGFCGMFADGVGDLTGHLLGAVVRHGGVLANLEFFNYLRLGDLDRRVPLYPSDLVGARLLRAGEPATELAGALARHTAEKMEIGTFRDYWIANRHVPHTVEMADRTAVLGPVKGFSMGGVDPVRTAAAVAGLHVTGEGRYGLSVDSTFGKPFPWFLATGAELADELAGTTAVTTGLEPAAVPPAEAASAAGDLRAELRTRTAEFQHHRFSAERAEDFVAWCGAERARLGERDCTGADTLLLAEAYARSVLAREESRGFFHRPDFPAANPDFEHRVTVATYDSSNDRISVSTAPVSERSLV